MNYLIVLLILYHSAQNSTFPKKKSDWFSLSHLPAYSVGGEAVGVSINMLHRIIRAKPGIQDHLVCTSHYGK